MNVQMEAKLLPQIEHISTGQEKMCVSINVNSYIQARVAQ